MLVTLFAWCIYAFIFLAFGKLLISFCNHFLKKNNYGLCDTFFFGICFVGTALSVLSIWVPINTYSGWGLFIISVLYSFYSYKYKKDYFLSDIIKKIKGLSLSAKVLSLFAITTILFFCLLPPFLSDMKLYYLQSIMWNETYPVIPGLGNIHGRFGFNSNILLLTSALSLNDIIGFRIYAILGLSMVVFFIWIINKISISDSFIQKIALIFFCFAFIHFYYLFVSSPSTDILPNILVSYILLKALLEKDIIKNSPLIFLILPVYAVTLKLSVIPVCLFCLVIIFQLIREKEYKTLAFVSCLALAVIIPWCTRTIILTGYLIYPYASLDLFNFDWEIPKEFVEIEQRWVTSWAKMPGISYEEFEKMPIEDWLKIWMARRVNFMKITTFVLCMSGISVLMMSWIWKTSKKISFMQMFTWFVAFCGFIFWFILAPDERFGASFILVTAIAPFLILKKTSKNKITEKLSPVLFVILLAFAIYQGLPLFNDHKQNKSFISYLYTPQTIDAFDKKRETTFREKQVNTIILYVAENSLCSDHKLPCAPHYDERLEMRGKYIKDGFRIKK